MSFNIDANANTNADAVPDAVDEGRRRSRNHRFSFRIVSLFIIILTMSIILNISIHRRYLFQFDNSDHHEVLLDGDDDGQDRDPDPDINTPLEVVKQNLSKKSSFTKTTTKTKIRTLGKMQCDKYGGANQTVADDMVYWYDIPLDAEYLNPFQQKNRKEGREQFLLFEKDPAGFNNFRMSLETILIMGISMGRTIVMPPEQPMYLWNKGANKKNKKQKKRFSIHDFYHIKEAIAEHFGVEIISMDEFIALSKKRGLFKNSTSGEIINPPEPSTNWDEAEGWELDQLYTWLGNNGYAWNGWDSNSCFTFWPNATDTNSTAQSRVEKLVKFKRKPQPADFYNKPRPVNATVRERLAEHLAGRTELCYYNESMQNAQVLVSHHVWDPSEENGNRFLSPFYTFHFFESWEQALWTKRFVRDHLRYHDELICIAARVVDAIRKRVRDRGLVDNPSEAFNTLHIRRGDFKSQYEATQHGAEELYNYSKNFLQPNSTVFIATDERNKTYFEPFSKHYDVCFLDDFKHVIEGVNSNYYGVIDQLVAAKGDAFVGTFWSTLSAYVNRMRGYYSVRDKLPGYEKGQLKSYYFMPQHKQKVMTRYFATNGGLWAHEFPTSWRDIDFGIPEVE